MDPTKSEFKTVRVWARSREVSPELHYSLQICSSAAFCRAAVQRRTALHMRKTAGRACTSQRMHRTARGAHMLINSSHGRELVQFVASLIKSDKLWKVLSGCLEKCPHGWSLRYSNLPLINLKPSKGFFEGKPQAASKDFPLFVPELSWNWDWSKTYNFKYALNPK